MQEAHRLHHQRTALAQAHGEQPPASSRVCEEFAYAAASWSQSWRVIVKAEVMAAGDNPRFVVTSLEAPTPQRVYKELYCARGNGENAIKAVKCALRTHTLAHTALATAPSGTVILTLFKVATHVKQYKDRIRLHLPTSCPVKVLLPRVTTLLSAVPVPVWNTS
jgi:hypothetical protein